MKNFYDDYKGFIHACIAISAGTTIGFVCARFINEKLSNHAFYNCDNGNLIFFQDALVGGRYICFKK